MEIIIASDIFGRTPELEDIAARLSINEPNLTLMDPYGGRDHAFKNEYEAYNFFQKEVGIEPYINTIFEVITNKKRPLFLLGFSIGASAIWALSDKLSGQVNTRAMCFYGSQIRYFKDVRPNFSMELIFPEHEPHFNVDQLLSQISLIKNVVCHREENLHGFMNKRSVNFNKQAYEKYMGCIKERLTQFENNQVSGDPARKSLL